MKQEIISYDPSNGEELGSVPVTGKEELKAIVSDAHRAAKEWRALSFEERVVHLEQAYARMEPHIRALAELLSREMGKDIRRSSGEVGGSVHGGPYFARAAMDALQPRHMGGDTTVEYRPLGVVAVISPWNYPLAMANNLIVPALAAGNTVVFKPSEETPLIANAFFGRLKDLLPDHVLQVVHGDGELGRELVSSDINMIAFTGSQAAGKDIMARAAGGVKRLVMELGGNDPLIVMNSADIEAAARFAVASSFENAGQMCTSTERIYVDEAIADAFEKRVTVIASQYRVGPWNMPGVQIGPIINERQHRKVIDHIKDAEGKGARILLGGSEQPDRFIHPTVISGMTPEMAMEQEETFGPVVAISRFTALDEAIARANDSTYGLGAVVFGGNGAEEVAAQLEAGMVGINQWVGGGGDAPWVGAKQSGFGFHGSADGHRQFAQVRVVSR